MTSTTPLHVLVLAAGLGKRMRSRTVKVLHPVCHRPMLAWVLDAARALRPRTLAVVVGHQADAVREAVAAEDVRFVLQRRQLGTGHAVLQARALLNRRARDTVLILNGDLPTLRAGTLRRLVRRHRRTGAALTLLTAELDDPSGYGRIVRDTDGGVTAIVEETDADAAQRRIREVNCGIYLAEAGPLFRALEKVRPQNAQAEYYLTDAVRILLSLGESVATYFHDDAGEVLGVNTRAELAQANRTLYRRKAEALMDRGVTVLAPEVTWVDPRARVGRDCVLHPNVCVVGPCRIGEGTVLGPGVVLTGAVLGRGVEVKAYSVITDSRVGDGAAIGPFAHLRPGNVLGAETRIGNFVELKKAVLARGVKANHLTYLGDATIGAGTNVGAGTITCNYDGQAKHPTHLGRRVFIGSDTQLVAPVRVGDGAYVGAGTTVTEDVPAGALALSRTPQVNIEGWVVRKKKKSKKTAR